MCKILSDDALLQIWSQLGLDASLSVPGYGTGNKVSAHNFSICLTRQLSSNTNVKLPAAVQSACLDNIEVKLEFSNCSVANDSKRQNLHPATRNSLESLMALESDFLPRNPCESQTVERAEIEASNALGLNHNFWYQRQTFPQERNDDRSSCSSLTTVIINTDSLLNDSSELSTSHAIDEERLSKTSAMWNNQTSHKVPFQVLVRLVDASLRMMISEYRIPKSSNLMLASTDGKPKLNLISPSTFRPGFAQVRIFTW